MTDYLYKARAAPAEDADHIGMAEEHIAEQMDRLSEALEATGWDAAALFEQAAHAAHEAEYRFLAARAAIYHQHRQAMQAAGLLPCSRCEAWLKPEEMEKVSYGYPRDAKDGQEPQMSFYWRCKECGNE